MGVESCYVRFLPTVIFHDFFERFVVKQTRRSLNRLDVCDFSRRVMVVVLRCTESWFVLLRVSRLLFSNLFSRQKVVIVLLGFGDC